MKANDQGPDESQLRAALCEDPGDPGKWLVYADWLMEHHSLRGELIGLQHAHKPQKLALKTKKLLDREAPESVRVALKRGVVVASQEMGHWAVLTAKPEPSMGMAGEGAEQLAPDPTEAVNEMIRMPLGQFIRSIQITTDSEAAASSLVGSISIFARCLRELECVCRTPWSATGLWETPRLETVRLQWVSDLGRVQHPRLRTLKVLLAANHEPVTAIRCPELRSLELMGASRVTELSSGGLPSLRRVATDSVVLLDELVRSGLAPQLTKLNLAGDAKAELNRRPSLRTAFEHAH